MWREESWLVWLLAWLAIWGDSTVEWVFSNVSSCWYCSWVRGGLGWEIVGCDWFSRIDILTAENGFNWVFLWLIDNQEESHEVKTLLNNMPCSATVFAHRSVLFRIWFVEITLRGQSSTIIECNWSFSLAAWMHNQPLLLFLNQWENVIHWW